jgi:predicted ArsR family transcriptional regulator
MGIAFRMKGMRSTPEDIRRLALLDEPTRRRLYDFVRASMRPVGRDEAAASMGISRGLAAFHLDRLTDHGLLEATFLRLSGRTGRGAGRPAKLYRATDRRVAVSVPETRYDLAGAVLARAIEQRRGGEDGQRAVRRAAGERGRDIGATLAATNPRGTEVRRVEQALEELGFEPTVDRRRGLIRLGNCPFHALVEQSRDLVCGLNGALLAGLLEGLSARGMAPEADPDPGACCMRIRGEPRP